MMPALMQAPKLKLIMGGGGGGYPVLDPTLKQSQSQPNQHGPQVLPGAPGLSPHAGKALQGCGLCSDPHGQLKFHRPR